MSFNKSIGNINKIPDFSTENATIENLTTTTVTGIASLTTGNITMNTGATLETNDIVSKTGSDITIDAVGDQRIIFGTLSNFGTSFHSAVDTNWGADFRNNTANFMAVAGTYNQSGDHRPQIGAHQISPLAWDVLWLNPVSVANSLVCVGDMNRSDVIAEDAKLMVVGSITATVDLQTRNNLVLKK